MERSLVGVDGSAPSLKAVDFAADLAIKYDAELILLKVVPHLPPELDSAVEEYARSEHIPVPAAELMLTMANGILDDGRAVCRRPGPRNHYSSSGSAGRPDRR